MRRPGLLAVFTEGDKVRGLGHVSRCSAYAEAWSDRGGPVCWVLDGDAAAVNLIGEGATVSIRRWQEGEVGYAGPPVEVALVDSYVATVDALEAVAAGARVTVFIDDLGRAYPPGVVVHPAPDRSKTSSSGQGASEWLEGPAWQPLRKPFRDLQGRASIRREIERILVVFGGGDLRRIGATMTRLACDVCPTARVDLVLGAGQSAPDASPNVLVHHALDAQAMASLMLDADVAITAAGQTVFELARCGTPAILVGVADNQQPNLDHWPDLCGYVSAGQWDVPGRDQRVRAGLDRLAAPDERQRISRRASEIVDGQGVRRLFDHLEHSILKEGV